MTTAREWLVAKGLAKAGRGKFSNAAKDALSKAGKEGVRFSDWPKGNTAPVKSTSVSKASNEPVGKSAPTESLYVSPSDFRFPEDEYVAVAVIDGKRVRYSMRECCNTCKVSLTNHPCNAPSIHDNISVLIERR